MDQVRLYLKTPLFAFRRAPHLPRTAMVLEGSAEDRPGGLRIHVSAWLEEAGEAVVGPTLTLLIPFAKIDHVHILNESSP